MVKKILHNIADKENFALEDFSPLSGGDINDTYLLKTSNGKLVIKLNKAKAFPNMFKKEASGLKLLSKAKAFQIPEVIATGEVHEDAYILLNYITPGNKNSSFWKSFGEKLAKLHQLTSESFGLNEDNYIGSLPQYNFSDYTDAAEFYIEKRLKPQLQMAQKNAFDFGNLSSFFKNISNIIPREKPNLIHGDLWSGNYMINSNGEPCLIDPAVAFAPREMDIGMMHLFGGFSEELFTSYHNSFPLAKGWEQRLPIWQLYYLLVHLNIFGSGYYSSVNRIIKQFS